MSTGSAMMLIVEDNVYNQDMLSRWLSKLGYTTQVAENGRQALEMLQHQAFDLMLLDIMMPEMNGYEVLEKLKADAKLHQLPVIIISSVDEVDSVVKCIELGAEDYLLKPFNRVLLKARISAALEKKRLREQEAVYMQQMLAAQKMASLGTLAAGVAHEMNSPLQVITGTSETLLYSIDQGDLAPEHLRHYAELIQRNAWRCARISTALRTYAQAAPNQLAPHDLNTLAQDALLLAGTSTSAAQPLTLKTEFKPDLPPLDCDGQQIIQALINLITNARDAMPNGGQLTLRTDYAPAPGLFQVQVSDTGMGIPESLKARIFDPFFTTKPIGQGMGLGLSILGAIIKAHHGQVEVSSTPGQGTTFTLWLPQRLSPDETQARRKSGGRFDDTLLPPAHPE